MAGPLAVAFADCPEMGAMCEGLCGIQAPGDAARAQPSGVAAAVTLPRIALFMPSGLEPPPKLVCLPA